MGSTHAGRSDDEGEHWIGGLPIDERMHVSDPDAAQSDDGVIHVIYDFDRYGVRQIALADITEEQIRARSPAAVPTIVNRSA